MQKKEKTTVCEAGIVALCFNQDKTRAVFSPNNHLIYIADCSKSLKDCIQWEIIDTLEQHDQSVTGLSWHLASNRILSCAQDRTAFVWAQNEATGKWNPSLVMLDSAIKRGLTCCGWSANGLKIYFGGAWKNIAVGRYDPGNEWWYCQPIEKHQSAITCLSPHPTNNTVLATGSTDCTLTIVSTFVKSVDGKDTVQQKLGTVLQDFNVGAWANAVSWSPSGRSIAVCTHDSRIHIFSGELANFQDYVGRTVTLKILPMRALSFVSEDMLIAAGYDFYPILVDQDGASKVWSVAGKWTADRELKREQSAAELARARFQNQASTGQAEAVETAKTRHKSVIVSVVPFVSNATKDDLKVPLFATGSMDGRVECWVFEDIITS